jgi:hypothetical protein
MPFGPLDRPQATAHLQIAARRGLWEAAAGRVPAGVNEEKRAACGRAAMQTAGVDHAVTADGLHLSVEG